MKSLNNLQTYFFDLRKILYNIRISCFEFNDLYKFLQVWRVNITEDRLLFDKMFQLIFIESNKMGHLFCVCTFKKDVKFFDAFWSYSYTALDHRTF